MGALTHNGEVLQRLPADASQINFDKTGTNLNSTQTEAAIKEVNGKVNTNTEDITQLKSGLITPSASYLLLGSAAIDGSNPVTVSLGDNDINDYDFIWIGTAYYNSGVATYGCVLIPVIIMHYLYSGDAGVSIISRDNTNQGVIPINAVYDSTNNNIRFSPEGTPAGQYYFVNGVKIRTAS